MKTGERRSLVIAVAAIIFALFGFDVRCAHLEEYISAQDFYKYNELFSFLQVENRITYATINLICKE
jgi:preprotein translocase subunit SecA